MKKLSILFFIFLLSACIPVEKSTPFSAPSATPPSFMGEVRPDLAQYFQGMDGAFVLYDLNRDHFIRFNPERCAERFLPASTFKIMNSLIALETGVATDENFAIPWNGKHYSLDAWNHDQTLKTAVQDSVVWYFQEIARRIGKERMQQSIDAVGYGNRVIIGNIDSFWLDGGLRISADEQVAFLKRLYQNNLPFSARSMKIVKEILVLEKKEQYTLSGKTGSVQRVGRQQGWFVGYLETKGDVYFFATNLESPNPDGTANGPFAQKITIDILRGLDLLP